MSKVVMAHHQGKNGVASKDVDDPGVIAEITGPLPGPEDERPGVEFKGTLRGKRGKVASAEDEVFCVAHVDHVVVRKTIAAFADRIILASKILGDVAHVRITIHHTFRQVLLPTALGMLGRIYESDFPRGVPRAAREK
jgi:hypothetical protein